VRAHSPFACLYRVGLTSEPVVGRRCSVCKGQGVGCDGEGEGGRVRVKEFGREEEEECG
jgi:hypothetical protein